MSTIRSFVVQTSTNVSLTTVVAVQTPHAQIPSAVSFVLVAVHTLETASTVVTKIVIIWVSKLTTKKAMLLDNYNLGLCTAVHFSIPRWLFHEIMSQQCGSCKSANGGNLYHHRRPRSCYNHHCHPFFFSKDSL